MAHAHRRRRRAAGVGAALLLAGAGCTYGVPGLAPLDGGGTLVPDAGAPRGTPDASLPTDGALPTDSGSTPPSDAPSFDASDAPCAPSGITLENTYLFEPTAATAMVTILGAPRAPAVGDVLVGYVAMRGSFSSGTPSVVPPSGWQAIGQGLSHGAGGGGGGGGTGGNGTTDSDSALAVFVDVVAPGDTALYGFTLGATVDAVGWVLDYANVDAQQPVDVQAFQSQAAGSSMFTSPFLTTTGPNEQIVASYGLAGRYSTALAGPPGFTSRAYAALPNEESGSSWDATQNMPGGIGGYTFAPASPPQSSLGAAVVHLLALRRCQ